MDTTTRLTASAAYGQSGHFIARITGRDPKFTFARTFVGRKTGKRKDGAEHTTDEPGLYETRDVDRKGRKDDTYHVVERLPDGSLDASTCTLQEAMALAKLFDAGASFEDAVAKLWPPKPAAADPDFDPISLGM